jgi:hypothetical protein
MSVLKKVVKAIEWFFAPLTLLFIMVITLFLQTQIAEEYSSMYYNLVLTLGVLIYLATNAIVSAIDGLKNDKEK